MTQFFSNLTPQPAGGTAPGRHRGRPLPRLLLGLLLLTALAGGLLHPLGARAQYSVTTLAGASTAGFSGDGGAATSAQLRSPYGTAVDAAGNLFIADAFNQRIRRVDAATGVISTVAGTGTSGFSGDGGAATSAQFNNPVGVAVDAAGNLFIADRSNQRIRKVTAAGVISTVAGTGTSGFSGDGGAATSAQLAGPSGVAVDAAGDRKSVV